MKVTRTDNGWLKFDRDDGTHIIEIKLPGEPTRDELEKFIDHLHSEFVLSSADWTLVRDHLLYGNN